MVRLKVAGLAAAVVLSVGGGAAASASARGLDWAVNGVPLPEGKTIKGMTVTSLTATTISSPEAGITFICKTAKGAGTIVGGKEGTGTMVVKPGGCKVEGDPKCAVRGHYEVLPTVWGPDTAQEGKIIIEQTLAYQNNFRMAVTETKTPGCKHVGEYPIVGTVDNVVPGPEGEEEETIAPSPPLPHSNLTVRGKPAVWTGSYKVHLPKTVPGKFGFAEL